MSRRLNPDGLVARCQCCGAIVVAVDLNHAPRRREQRSILALCTRRGLTLEPRWEPWRDPVSRCTCDEPAEPPADDPLPWPPDEQILADLEAVDKSC